MSVIARRDRAAARELKLRALLHSVQSSSERVSYRRRRLQDAAGDLQRDVLAAAAGGATVDELVAAGVELGYVQQLLDDRGMVAR